MKTCGNPECSTSTGICGSLTYGSGELDDYGYWEIPCPTCARAHEEKHPEDGDCWPFRRKCERCVGFAPTVTCDKPAEWEFHYHYATTKLDHLIAEQVGYIELNRVMVGVTYLCDEHVSDDYPDLKKENMPNNLEPNWLRKHK